MIEKIAAQIKARLGAYSPETAVILGSGLGALGDLVENPVIIPYAEIEGFPQSTVSGHKGRLIIGRLEGKDILCMQGRVHLYEGHSPQSINTFIKAFQLLGIKNLIVTNASGSLTAELPAGTFVGFILLLAVTMIAAPGVPGGAIMAALGLLESMLGFDETLAGLMIATYIAMDSFGTATNVTGDGAVAVIVDAIDRRR